MTNLQELVSALPNTYQPIFGHPELQYEAWRPCEDRFERIRTVCRALSAKLGRPLRILDLGCAQGYFSLSFARDGHTVVGIDFCAENIAVCNALREEHPKLDLRFEEESIETILPRIAPGQYDVALGLSVFQLLCVRHGPQKVASWISELAATVSIAFFELALSIEPPYQGAPLPPDELDLLDGFLIIQELGRYRSHASDVYRPLYMCSNDTWFLADQCTFVDAPAIGRTRKTIAVLRAELCAAEQRCVNAKVELAEAQARASSRRWLLITLAKRLLRYPHDIWLRRRHRRLSHQ